MVRINRACNPVAEMDSARFLVKRLWPMAYILVASYLIFISRCYYGKVSAKHDSLGFY